MNLTSTLLMKGPRPSSLETGFKGNLNTSFLVSRPSEERLKALGLMTLVSPLSLGWAPSMVCGRPNFHTQAVFSTPAW